MNYKMTQPELNERLKTLLTAIGTRQRLTLQETNEMFLLHNTLAENKWIKAPIEFGKSCGSCSLRVFKRLHSYNDTI